MGEIKTAFERAMEKIKDLEKATPEEMRRMEHVPRGEALAARYLRGDINDLQAEIARHEAKVRAYLLEGALEALLSNIALPRDSRTKQTNAKAMQGVLSLKKNSKRVKDGFDQIERVFTSYEAAVQQTYGQLKQEFEAKLAQAKKSLEQQYGAPVKIDVEAYPQFQDEWRQVRASLDVKYEQVLAEHKQGIRAGS